MEGYFTVHMDVNIVKVDNQALISTCNRDRSSPEADYLMPPLSLQLL